MGGLLLCLDTGAPLIDAALVVTVALECRRSLRRVGLRVGAVSVNSGNAWEWRGRRWLMVRRPWLVSLGMLVTLEDTRGQRERLWLMRDSLDEGSWRALRAVYSVLNGEVTAVPPSRSESARTTGRCALR
ncbi:hypothetical protein PMPD1_3613 [Paramixta manurensis]|uniref:Uncharacterized protein n=2 Tax=Paramixta manurensis TaxID=2740817 RepID=A0A6M8UFD4_9GAMM|nr:hypothetical protein PMPD1_3613 [Erwiniaceae bacterium PD-1]